MSTVYGCCARCVINDPEIAILVYRAIVNGEVKIAEWNRMTGPSAMTAAGMKDALGSIYIWNMHPNRETTFRADYNGLTSPEMAEADVRAWLSDRVTADGWTIVPAAQVPA